jgi:hypothetical protein
MASSSSGWHVSAILKGIVAKRRYGGYGDSWWKIRNPNYTQYEGRNELFEKRVGAATGSAI